MKKTKIIFLATLTLLGILTATASGLAAGKCETPKIIDCANSTNMKKIYKVCVVKAKLTCKKASITKPAVKPSIHSANIPQVKERTAHFYTYQLL